MADGTGTIPQVRALIGDGDSQWFTDDEIQVYLDVTDANALRAAGTALQNLAVNFAVKGRSIKTDDLGIDTRSRSTALAALAKQYFAQADDVDKLGAGDIFEIVATGDHSASFGYDFAGGLSPFEPDPLNPGYFIP